MPQGVVGMGFDVLLVINKTLKWLEVLADGERVSASFVRVIAQIQEPLCELG